MAVQDGSMRRRRFLSIAVMGTSLVAAYGLFASFVLKFLYPTRARKHLAKMFVGFSGRVPVGSSISFFTPKGDRVILTNTGQPKPNMAHTFSAFSSRCPHLGCKVHYDAGTSQFICPCHQGVFGRDGVALSGPPAQANQRLAEYDVVQEGNSLYVMVETG